jgi:hypothetical protein
MAEVLKYGSSSSRIARRSLGSKYELAWRQSFSRCLDDRLRDPWCDGASDGKTNDFISFHSGRQSNVRSSPGFK